MWAFSTSKLDIEFGKIIKEIEDQRVKFGAWTRAAIFGFKFGLRAEFIC